MSSLEKVEEDLLTKVASHANKSEKMSWERKNRNLKKFMAELEPIESKIIELIAEKNTILDRVIVTRNQMVDNCIHPKKELELHNGEIICKFCERKFGVVIDADKTEG